MEVKILNQKKNPFLHREELMLELSAESTPSFDELKTELGKGEELTVVKKIENSFGKQKFKAEVFVYDSAESKNKVEVIPKKIRKKMEEEAAKAAEEAKKKAEEEAKAADTLKGTSEAKKAEAEAASADTENKEEAQAGESKE